MRVRLPLSGQILALLMLNAALLAAVFYLFLRFEFRLGLNSLLLGPAGDRIQLRAQAVSDRLSATPRDGWDAVLDEFSTGQELLFTLFQNDAVQSAGRPVRLPPEVREKFSVNRPRGRPPKENRAGEDRSGPAAGAAPATKPELAGKFMVRTSSPTRYWVGVRVAVADGQHLRPVQRTLLVVSRSLRADGLVLDTAPWWLAAGGSLALSGLLWLPFVHGITRSIAEVTEATERIADGSFDVHVKEHRPDELGRLGHAINRLGTRLATFVNGQKRFLGDVAHELCSPIARLQMALGILEQRAGESQRAAVADLAEEIEEMSHLVSELLSLSKAGLRPGAVQRSTVLLAGIVRRVIEREAREGTVFECQVADDMTAFAEPELLARALANVVRNAVRYAGGAGPITITARDRAEGVSITIADCGPGVPAASLPRLFDPFYRVDDSRTRQTGGAGLGLAIVRTCIEACGGRVTAGNREPSGLEVCLSLPHGSPGDGGT